MPWATICLGKHSKTINSERASETDSVKIERCYSGSHLFYFHSYGVDIHPRGFSTTFSADGAVLLVLKSILADSLNFIE